MNVKFQKDGVDVSNNITHEIKPLIVNKSKISQLNIRVTKNEISIDIETEIKMGKESIFDDESIKHYKKNLENWYKKYLFKQWLVLNYAYEYDSEPSQTNLLSLVRILGILSLKKIKFVDELEIKDIISKDEPKHRDIIFEKERPITPIDELGFVDAMGCYSKEEKTIYICLDNIDETHDTLSFDSEDLLEIVFYHELGHSIFAYQDLPFNMTGRIKQEKQANYIASSATDGKFDTIIKKLSEEQLSQYRNPLLSKEFYVFEKNPLDFIKYNEICEEYEKSVMELYIN